MLRVDWNDVEVDPVLQEVSGETLNHGANKAPDTCLDIHVRGFWERQRFTFFDVRVRHRNADSYKDLTPKQIYKKHENEKKRQYAERVMEIEQGTFTPLVFTTTGGMVACENIRFSSLFAAGDVSRGGTSATQRQKFHTDDANQCLHNKFGSHGAPNTNLPNFTCLLVDFSNVLCSPANELQQNS